MKAFIFFHTLVVCPEDFSNPFMGSVYYLEKGVTRNWTEVQDKCASLGSNAHAVAIDSLEENQHIANILNAKGEMCLIKKHY